MFHKITEFKEWLNETKHLIEMNYDGNENEFDRCMKVTKRSRNFFKEAMRREDYYRNSMMLSGVCRMLTEGYLTLDDLKELSQELQTSIKLMAGKNDS